jgi:hypothetical protein
MPAANPRISVVLTPSLGALLAALSEATGESASSLVRGMLEQTEPALQRMLQLVTATKLAKGNIGGGVAEALHRVVTDLEAAVSSADARVGWAADDLVRQAETVQQRRRRGSAGGAPSEAVRVSPTPGLVTRGSGRPSRVQVKAKKAGHRGQV